MQPITIVKKFGECDMQEKDEYDIDSNGSSSNKQQSPKVWYQIQLVTKVFLLLKLQQSFKSDKMLVFWDSNICDIDFVLTIFEIILWQENHEGIMTFEADCINKYQEDWVDRFPVNMPGGWRSINFWRLVNHYDDPLVRS